MILDEVRAGIQDEVREVVLGSVGAQLSSEARAVIQGLASRGAMA